MNQDIVENVNVAADQYWAIADELGTEHGWSVLEHVQLCKELLWKSLVAIGRQGANADANHPNRKLWEELRDCLSGLAPGGAFDP